VKEHSSFRFTFRPATPADRPLIHAWTAQAHIQEWMHGVGLKNALEGLERFFKGSGETHHWIACDQGIPFGYLLTSPIVKQPPSEHASYCLEKGDAITLDVFICDLLYLGKGLSHLLIREFLLSKFPNVSEVLIDPEERNVRAIRAYEKVGFRIVGKFIAPWHPVPHLMMRLSMKELKKKITG